MLFVPSPLRWVVKLRSQTVPGGRGVPGQEVGDSVGLSKAQIESCLSSASNTSVRSFIHSANTDKGTYCGPGSLPRAGDMAVNEEDRSPCPPGAFSLVQEDNKGMSGHLARCSLASGPCTCHCLWREDLLSLHLCSNSSLPRCQLRGCLLLEALLETPSLGLASFLWVPTATRAAVAQHTFLWVCCSVHVTVTPLPWEPSRGRGQVCLIHHDLSSAW